MITIHTHTHTNLLDLIYPLCRPITAAEMATLPVAERYIVSRCHTLVNEVTKVKHSLSSIFMLLCPSLTHIFSLAHTHKRAHESRHAHSLLSLSLTQTNTLSLSLRPWRATTSVMLADRYMNSYGTNMLTGTSKCPKRE